MIERVVVPGRTVARVQGDITRSPVDAIVDAANSGLAGSGVDGAIQRAGGLAIMADLDLPTAVTSIDMWTCTAFGHLAVSVLTMAPIARAQRPGEGPIRLLT